MDKRTRVVVVVVVVVKFIADVCLHQSVNQLYLEIQLESLEALHHFLSPLKTYDLK